MFGVRHRKGETLDEQVSRQLLLVPSFFKHPRVADITDF